MSINPRKYSVQLKDNNGVLVSMLDNKINTLSWEWDKNGGCGACNINLKESWDAILAGSFAEDYEVNIFAGIGAGTAELFYSGQIDKVNPTVTGKDETINLFCLGYVNQLKRVIVRDKTYLGYEISDVVKNVIESFVTSITKITSTAADYEFGNFTADKLYFNESAYDVISKLADIAGKTEWGVRADKSFFFKKRNDKITRWFHIGESLVNFTPIKDYHPIITRIYLLGGEGYSGVFSVTNKTSIREEIVSNSAIITQSVGQQFARMYLKEKGVIHRSYTAEIPDIDQRIESTIPLGKAAVNMKIGIQKKYNDATALYNSGLKYDGGTESFQIEKIKYTLQDDILNATLNFGPAPANLADELAKLEYLLTAERNS